MPRSITIDMLREFGACRSQAVSFEQRYPDGVTFADEADAIRQCLAEATDWDWGWAAKNLLTAQAMAKYEAAVAPAGEKHRSDTAMARAEYKWEEFLAAVAPAWSEYKAAMAVAFAVAFMDKMN